MLCYTLSNINDPGFDPASLMRGASFTEPTRANLANWEIDRIHEGKDSSILNMQAGGNGYPPCRLQTHMARAAFDVGVKRERDDMRSLNFWSASLKNCQLDMHRRFSV